MLFHADSEDSDQTGQMPRLIIVFIGRKGHFVGFVMKRLKFIGMKWNHHWQNKKINTDKTKYLVLSMICDFFRNKFCHSCHL